MKIKTKDIIIFIIMVIVIDLIIVEAHYRYHLYDEPVISDTEYDTE